MTEQRVNYDVAVIGLGAVGSAALYHLSKSGKRIVGLDRFEPPHTLGSSHGESRITRLAVGEGEDYVALAKRSHEIWQEIEALTGQKIMTKTSGILMDSGLQPWAKYGSEGFWDRTVAIANRQGIPHETLDSDQLKKRFPAFLHSDSGKAYLEFEAGYLRPETAIQVQLDLAKKNGAKCLFNSPVEEITSSEKSILIRTENLEIHAERVVLCAGGWIKDFLPQAEKTSFKICRQVLHWLKIEPETIDWKNYPVWMWGFGPQPEDFIYGFPSLDGTSVKMASESFTDSLHPDRLDRTVSREEQELFWKEKVEGKIFGLRHEFVKSVVCFYTVTEDARFVIKTLPGMENVLIASACSGHGFKHSTALGERLAHTLLDL
ncbi:N-methyl-L-tryptophan oxidase [Algoriphagus litoralis]|uniref:N-methyl-L-tryptophan oxidase n=1 Tax=Algoriphagus litoralis TaxID=2202829 RepID=UPI000DBA6CF8|nr:N-methyl-L-tryptophan oxidase [Algoriphagus litoralis]